MLKLSIATFFISLVLSCATNPPQKLVHQALPTQKITPENKEWLIQHADTMGIYTERDIKDTVYIPSKAVCSEIKAGRLDSSIIKEYKEKGIEILKDSLWKMNYSKNEFYDYLPYDQYLDYMQIQDPQKIKKNIRILSYGSYLLLAEENKGIHIFLKQSSQQPEKALGFLPVPGITDIAIRNDLLYANSLEHLVIFDISEITEPKLISFEKSTLDVYHKLGSIERDYYESPENQNQICKEGFNSQGFLKGYYNHYTYTIKCIDDGMGFIKKEIPQLDHAKLPKPLECEFHEIYTLDDTSDNDSHNDIKSGKGGSLNRFAITDKHLYFVDRMNIRDYKINSKGTLDLNHSISFGEPYLGFNMNFEMIHYNKARLFVGSPTYTYLLEESNADTLKRASAIPHLSKEISSILRDPIFVFENTAYITLPTEPWDIPYPRIVKRIKSQLRDTLVMNGLNEIEADSLISQKSDSIQHEAISQFNTLQVYNIEDMTNPILQQTFYLKQPAGLAKWNNYLLICNSFIGYIETFKINENNLLEPIASDNSIHCLDLIIEENTLHTINDKEWVNESHQNYEISIKSNVVKFTPLNNQN